jgi:hypothetical protein
MGRRSYTGLMSLPAWGLFDRDGKLVASIRAKTAFEAKLLFKSGLVEGDLERGHVIRRL